MDQRANQNNRGFTMIELMVTVAILAVTASLSVPSFLEVLAAQRVRTTAYSMVSDLVLARSEAVKRGEDVTVTPADTEWANGWSVKVASTDEVLSEQSDVGNSVSFTTSPTGITFDRNGRTISASVVRFELSDGNTNRRCISLDPTGRPKSANTGCPT